MPASRKGEIETRGAMLRAPARLRPSLSDARQNFRDDLPLRLRTLRGAVVEAHAHCAGFHVATADDQHRVDAQLFRVGNLRLERRRAEIGIHPHHVRAEFVHDGLGVVDQRFVVVERDDAHLIRREPEREVAFRSFKNRLNRQWSLIECI